MRRLQISIDESLDDLLASEAARRRTSKAALIRHAVATVFGAPGEGSDPLDELVGDIDAEPVADIDAVVYGEA